MPEEAPRGDREYSGDWIIAGYYASKFFHAIGRLGDRACKSIARAGAYVRDDESTVTAVWLRPNVAPLPLTEQDTLDLHILESTDYPYQFNRTCLDSEVQKPGD